MDPITFQLPDADGRLHDYEVTPHMTTEGTPLMLSVLSTASEPISRLVAAYMKTQDTVSFEDDLGDILGRLDLSKIGTDLKATLAGLDADVLKKFFAHTRRDGKALHLITEYDKAYQGNWGEWMSALKEIVQANGFVPFLSTLTSE